MSASASANLVAGRAAPDDPVHVAHRRRDVIGRALDLDEEDGLTFGQLQIELPSQERVDRAAIQQLGSGR